MSDMTFQNGCFSAMKSFALLKASSTYEGYFFMFVESGCISTNIELRYHKYIYFERSSFCLSTDINFTSVALSLVKIYSFE